MKPYARLDAIACPIDGNDINTDQVLPGRFMQKPRFDYGRYFFHDLRPSSGTSSDDCSVFPPFRARYQGASILVCGSNFGCGSSREQAVHAAWDFGIRVVIAPSLGENFLTNCLKNGLLAVTLPDADVAELREWLATSTKPHLDVDLEHQIVRVPSTNRAFHYDLDAFSKTRLLSGMTDLDFTLSLADRLTAFENNELRAE
jgi:3-isopropylmalate/(R)-2-methylmalate dehydratase small subunit